MKTTQVKVHSCEFARYKSDDNKNAVYHRCTATELKEELCEMCPLPERIRKGIQEQILPQIFDQQSILTKEQFNDWIIREIESASKSMQEARLASTNDKDQAKQYASNWNELFHWNKARIQALNKAYIKTANTNFPNLSLKLKPNQCQYLYSELTKDGNFMPANTNQEHFEYVFVGGVCPENFTPLHWNKSKQALSELIIFITRKKSVPRSIQKNAEKVFVNNENNSIGKLSNPKKDEYSLDYGALETITKALKIHPI